MITIFTQISGNSPQRLTQDERNSFFKTVVFFGYSGFSTGIPLLNLNPVYIGLESGKLPFILNTGSYVNLTLTDKQRDNLSRFWFNGTSGEGLTVIAY